jgi:hypothetical protein
MSKTQDKKAARQAEADAFVKERREVQLAVFERNFKVGLEMYEQNKDSIPEKERLIIEEEIERNRALIDEWKEKWGPFDVGPQG